MAPIRPGCEGVARLAGDTGANDRVRTLRRPELAIAGLQPSDFTQLRLSQSLLINRLAIFGGALGALNLSPFRRHALAVRLIVFDGRLGLILGAETEPIHGWPRLHCVARRHVRALRILQRPGSAGNRDTARERFGAAGELKCRIDLLTQHRRFRNLHADSEIAYTPKNHGFNASASAKINLHMPANTLSVMLNLLEN